MSKAHSKLGSGADRCQRPLAHCNPSLAELPQRGSAADCEVGCNALAQRVCRAGGITGILVSSATHIARTLSSPFRENFGRLFAGVGHLYAYPKLVAP